MAGPFSGIGGTVKVGGTAVADVQSWSFTPKADNKEYSSSSTAGWKMQIPANKSCSGSFKILLDDTSGIPAAIKIGEIVALTLGANASVSYTGQAMITDIQPEVDIEGGDPVSAEVSFAGHGPWTGPGI